MQEQLPRRSNRRIASYVTVVKTKKTDKKTGQNSYIFESSLLRIISLLLLAGLLVSCASKLVKPVTHFQLQGRNYLYDKNKWFFSGRIALSNEKESLSLSISWNHNNKHDKIELAGSFGQGRTIFEITEKGIGIDDGEKRLQFVGSADVLVARHVGIKIPISALKYWVLGLVKPDTHFVGEENGFLQSEWRVQYQQMQLVDGDALPKKIKFERIEPRNEKLKLIIDHWES